MEKTVLVIGGAFQDKLKVALNYSSLSADKVSDGMDKRIVNNFQNYFKNPEKAFRRCNRKNKKKIQRGRK